MSDPDPTDVICYHKVQYGPGPYCTGCGGLINKTKKIEFWMHSRGNRNETKIVEFPIDYYEDDIKSELDDWLDSLKSTSDYITYGWREVK